MASGLDTVRKTLGKHELATVQTTSIDGAVGMVNLTTTLVHTSGEWVASEWPVGPVAAAANPYRMGAALTYACSRALFTLVGIAWEDDLEAQAPDAPGLVLPVSTGPAPRSVLNFEAASSPERPTPAVRKAGRVFQTPLPPQDSARLREGMLAEIQSLEAADASAWTQSTQATRNRLTAECANLLEAAFRAHFPELGEVEAKSGAPLSPPAEQPTEVGVGKEDPASGLGGEGQGLLAMTKTVRHRNKEHLRFVGTLPCLVCARQPSDAHHLRFAQPQALGRKVSDEFAVPLCRTHHRELHRSGNELQWWGNRKLTPLATAADLWRRTQSAPGEGGGAP